MILHNSLAILHKISGSSKTPIFNQFRVYYLNRAPDIDGDIDDALMVLVMSAEFDKLTYQGYRAEILGVLQ